MKRLSNLKPGLMALGLALSACTGKHSVPASVPATPTSSDAVPAQTTDGAQPTIVATEAPKELTSLQKLRAQMDTSEKAAADAPELQGMWTRGCVDNPVSKNFYGVFAKKRVSFEFRGNVAYKIRSWYRDTSCSGVPELADIETFLVTIGDEPIPGSGITAIDLIQVGKTMKTGWEYLARDMNEREVCGRKNWTKGVANECTQHLEFVMRDIYLIDKGELHFGLRWDGDSVANRPVLIELGTGFTRVKPTK